MALTRCALTVVVGIALAGALGGGARAQPASEQQIYPGTMGPGMMGSGMMGSGMMGSGTMAPGTTAPGMQGPGTLAPGGGGPSGEAVFAQACAGCHALQAGVRSAGPELHGLFGRRAGSLPGYPYSAAMRDSGIVWSAKTLDRFIADPRRVVPGTSMAFPGIPDPQIRARLIAYLATATR